MIQYFGRGNIIKIIQMEVCYRDKHYNAVKCTFGVTKISYGVLEQSYICNLWLEWTGEKSSTTGVCTC